MLASTAPLPSSAMWNSLRAAAPGTSGLSETTPAIANANKGEPTTTPATGCSPPSAAAVHGPGVKLLCVPADAWRELHERLASMEESQRDVKQYLRAHLRLERSRRESGATRLQARWRGIHVRWHHALGCAIRRRRFARERAKSLDASRLHCSPVAAVVATSHAEKRAMRLQGLARGFLVRRRVSLWRAQTSAATRLQSASRGLRSRRRHTPSLRSHRLEMRVAYLEAALRSEGRKREVSEAFLRRLGEAVKALNARATASAAKANVAASKPAASPITTSAAAATSAAATATSAAATTTSAAATATSAAAAGHNKQQDALGTLGYELAVAGDATLPRVASACVTASAASCADEIAAATPAAGITASPATAQVIAAAAATTTANATATCTTTISAAAADAPAAPTAVEASMLRPMLETSDAQTSNDAKARRAAAREAFVAARAAKAAQIGAQARVRAAREREEREAREREGSRATASERRNAMADATSKAVNTNNESEVTPQKREGARAGDMSDQDILAAAKADAVACMLPEWRARARVTDARVATLASEAACEHAGVGEDNSPTVARV